MSSTRKPYVGDIIRSTSFAFGWKDDTGIIYVGEGGNRTVSVEIQDSIVVEGKQYKRAEWKEVDRSADDETRGMASFLVIDARMRGGSSGRDAYPDGWHVTARRLDNPEEIIKFYMSGAFIQVIPEVELVATDYSPKILRHMVEAEMRGKVPDEALALILAKLAGE